MKRIIVALYFLINLPLYAETIHLESGIKKKTLIELYTSEGCNSCPPAEKYLNSYINNDGLWKTWIPVAFHVDYWDYIGWKDRYAAKKYGQRQSRYAKLKHASTVYTPAFFVNGKSWRHGIFSDSLKSATSNTGNLVVNLEGNLLEAKFKSNEKYSFPLKLNVALLGMNLSTFIERGENSGRHARHEFVVVGFSSKLSENHLWNMKIPKPHYNGAKKYALAIWLSQGDDPTPIQAVGTELPYFR